MKDRHATVENASYVSKNRGPRRSWKVVEDLYTADPQTVCWEWDRTVNREGYGAIRNGKKIEYAHRFIYKLLVGPIEDGKQLDHLCRNRRCVNPEHLEQVTRAENIRRGEMIKLTEQDIVEIRLTKGVELQSEVAKRYGVTASHVSRILSGQKWGKK